MPESWAHNDITYAELGLECYVMFRKDRIGKSHASIHDDTWLLTPSSFSCVWHFIELFREVEVGYVSVVSSVCVVRYSFHKFQ